MKTEKHQFHLIENVYSASLAKEVLTSLIIDKIRFLNVQILSTHERFGTDTSHLGKRVKELNAEMQKMIHELNSAIENDAEVEISCPVNISVKIPQHLEVE